MVGQYTGMVQMVPQSTQPSPITQLRILVEQYTGLVQMVPQSTQHLPTTQQVIMVGQ